MLQLLVMCFIACVCGTLMFLVWRPKTKLTIEQLRKEQYIIEEQTAIDAQQSIYRATIIRTSRTGSVSYKEVIVDEHVVYVLLSDTSK